MLFFVADEVQMDTTLWFNKDTACLVHNVTRALVRFQTEFLNSYAGVVNPAYLNCVPHDPLVKRGHNLAHTQCHKGANQISNQTPQ